MEFNASTCIDPVTNLIEITCLKGPKTAGNARILFEHNWLSQYPRPLRVVHDHGPEFHGHYFQFPLKYAGIKAINISPHTMLGPDSQLEIINSDVSDIPLFEVSEFRKNSDHRKAILLDDKISLIILIPQYYKVKFIP